MMKNNRSNFAKVIVLVVSLIVIGVSSTYAYFTSVISGDATETTLKAGNFKIDTNLESVNVINNQYMKLVDNKETESEKVSFYVKSTSESTVAGKYYIYLKEIKLTKNLYHNDFKWELLKNSDIVASGTFENASRTDTINVGEEDNVLTTINDIQLNAEENPLILEKNTTDNIVFRLWLQNDENKNQIDLINGSFSGKLYLEAVPISEN